MIIRDAELRDARGIAEVHVRSWQTAYAGIVPDEDLAQLSVDEREQFLGAKFSQRAYAHDHPHRCRRLSKSSCGFPDRLYVLPNLS
jgi:hypothetical protein